MHLVALLLLACLTCAGCVGPLRALRRAAEDDSVEMLIHVDEEGNVTRGKVSDAPPASQANDVPQAGPAPPMNSHAGPQMRGDRLPPVHADATRRDSMHDYNELAHAIGSPDVNAQRVAQMLAAHQRAAPSHARHRPAAAERVRQQAFPPRREQSPRREDSPRPEQSPRREHSRWGRNSHAPFQSRPSAPDQYNVLPATYRGPASSTIPHGVEPTVVNTLRFDLEYNDAVLGPGGTTKIEFFGTRDAGRTWQRLGTDPDGRSPYTVEMPGEGVFGFRMAVQGPNGFASRPPQPGDQPELWAKVELSGNLRVAQPHPPAQQRASVPQAISPAQPGMTPLHNHVASRENLDTGDWREHLQLAIEDLEARLDSKPQQNESAERDLARAVRRAVGHQPLDEAGGAAGGAALSDSERASHDAYLRLLYLASGRHEDAMRSSQHWNTEENAFWSHQLHGLKLLIQPHARLSQQRQTTAALAELHQAFDHLAAVSELQVQNLAFCVSARSFGVYETKVLEGRYQGQDYRQRRFQPEQPVVLYFEVSNFTSEQLTSRDFPDGAWLTSLRASYTITDDFGRAVDRRELKLRDDVCRNRRHDYFVAYNAWVPKLNPGRYTLELLVTDALSEKIGTSSIDFEVVSR